MECVCCGSAAVAERPERAARGCRRFRCRACGKQRDGRSGGLLSRAPCPSDVVALVVLWRLRHRLAPQNPSEVFLQRGVVFSHEAVRDWEARLAPVLAGELRRRRNGEGGAGRRRRRVDETYLKVRGRWCCLYRAIGRNGSLVDTMLSARRDMAAAQAFYGSHPRATHSTLGRHVAHRTSAHKDNRLGQGHRGVKGRTRCVRGFKSFASAERFCRGYDELRAFLRPRTRHNQHVPASRRRLLHPRRAGSALAMLEAAQAGLASHLMPSGLARALAEPPQFPRAVADGAQTKLDRCIPSHPIAT